MRRPPWTSRRSTWPIFSRTAGEAPGLAPDERPATDGCRVVAEWFGALSFVDTIIFTLGVKPSALPVVYWSHTLEDLIRLTDLKVQFEMVKAMSFTESLLFTAGQIFGAKQSAPTEELDSVSDMLAFAKMING